MRGPRLGVFTLGKFEQFGVFQNKMLEVVNITGRPRQVSTIQGTHAHDLASRWAHEENIKTKHVMFDRRISMKSSWVKHDTLTIVGFASLRLLNPTCDVMVGFVHEPGKNLQTILLNEAIDKAFYLFEI
jgi:hypothetical protein